MVKERKKKIVWRCISRLEYGTKYCKESPTIEENVLQSAILRAINSFADNREVISDTLKECLLTEINGISDEVDIAQITNKINAYNTEMIELVNSSENIDDIDDKLKAIHEEKEKLKSIVENHKKNQVLSQNENSRMIEISQMLENETYKITEYNESVVRSLIQQVKVLSKDNILIIFKCGYEMECNLE